MSVSNNLFVSYDGADASTEEADRVCNRTNMVIESARQSEAIPQICSECVLSLEQGRSLTTMKDEKGDGNTDHENEDDGQDHVNALSRAERIEEQNVERTTGEVPACLFIDMIVETS
jgi:hypothetical protein